MDTELTPELELMAFNVAIAITSLPYQELDPKLHYGYAHIYELLVSQSDAFVSDESLKLCPVILGHGICTFHSALETLYGFTAHKTKKLIDDRVFLQKFGRVKSRIYGFTLTVPPFSPFPTVPQAQCNMKILELVYETKISLLSHYFGKKTRNICHLIDSIRKSHTQMDVQAVSILIDCLIAEQKDEQTREKMSSCSTMSSDNGSVAINSNLVLEDQSVQTCLEENDEIDIDDDSSIRSCSKKRFQDCHETYQRKLSSSIRKKIKVSLGVEDDDEIDTIIYATVSSKFKKQQYFILCSNDEELSDLSDEDENCDDADDVCLPMNTSSMEYFKSVFANALRRR